MPHLMNNLVKLHNYTLQCTALNDVLSNVCRCDGYLMNINAFEVIN